MAIEYGSPGYKKLGFRFVGGTPHCCACTHGEADFNDLGLIIGYGVPKFRPMMSRLVGLSPECCACEDVEPPPPPPPSGGAFGSGPDGHDGYDIGADPPLSERLIVTANGMSLTAPVELMNNGPTLAESTAYGPVLDTRWTIVGKWDLHLLDMYTTGHRAVSHALLSVNAGGSSAPVVTVGTGDAFVGMGLGFSPTFFLIWGPPNIGSVGQRVVPNDFVISGLNGPCFRFDAATLGMNPFIGNQTYRSDEHRLDAGYGDYHGEAPVTTIPVPGWFYDASFVGWTLNWILNRYAYYTPGGMAALGVNRLYALMYYDVMLSPEHGGFVEMQPPEYTSWGRSPQQFPGPQVVTPYPIGAVKFDMTFAPFNPTFPP